MIYKTVFDASHQGYAPFWFPAYGLLFVAVGVLLLAKPDFIMRRMPSGFRGTPGKVFGVVFLTFAIFWTSVASIGTYSQIQNASSDLAQGDFSTVEGVVTNFVPEPYQGHRQESFDVQGHHFSYSDYLVTAGFHNSASHGGPLHEGLQVRIAYSGNLILRLEVAQ